MKKKVIGVLLATAMAFGLAACGNSAGGEAVKQETEKAEEAKAGTKEEKSGEVTTVNITVRQSRQSGVARATCPD